ncbi:MAG: DUF748 domain-containing protein [Bacteroidetes bacterium]|nr:DUF748 domain-containing protein [Bacteroidota bacterium]
MNSKGSKVKTLIRKYKIVLSVLLLLGIARVMLPYFVKQYVNSVLSDIPGYKGYVEDIDISLIRGAYVIEGMYLNIVEAQSEIPFLDFPHSDISIDWQSLFTGKIVSEIILKDPIMNFVIEDQDTSNGATQEDWTKALTDLVPFDINHLEIHNGTLALKGLRTSPRIDLKMEELEFQVNNLRNIISEKSSLPSQLKLSAKTFGNGVFNMEGRLNFLKEIPDLDFTMSLEGSNIVALNNLTNHYTKIDFEQGVFSFYSEVAIANGYLKGYVKPFLKDAKLIGKHENFRSKVRESLFGVVKFILKNQRTNSIAMKIPIEGDLKHVDANSWDTFLSIVKNAWFSALDTGTDGDIEFEDAVKPK